MNLSHPLLVIMAHDHMGTRTHVTDHREAQGIPVQETPVLLAMIFPNFSLQCHCPPAHLVKGGLPSTSMISSCP